MKLRSIKEQHCAIVFFEEVENIRNHPNNIGFATQSLLLRAENCIAAGGGHLELLL